uniref:Uncharacterized protein n=1 Tax=Pristionchus pacificus TaxID=54126 RepID=A0A2A6BJU8_PRIPA|eukprot:PDM66108.1 hypothetical protein PRIPAC_45333 [Pristionchus pacificus]
MERAQTWGGSETSAGPGKRKRESVGNLESAGMPERIEKEETLSKESQRMESGGKEEFGRKEEIRLRNLLGLSRVDNRCVSTAGHLQKVGGNDAEIGTEGARRRIRVIKGVVKQEFKGEHHIPERANC